MKNLSEVNYHIVKHNFAYLPPQLASPLATSPPDREGEGNLWNKTQQQNTKAMAMILWVRWDTPAPFFSPSKHLGLHLGTEIIVHKLITILKILTDS